jgi:DNA-binding NarL/FixJ family response regulator
MVAAGERGLPGPVKTRIMIVEDHQVFRMGLRELLNQEVDLAVCGEAGDADRAWEEIRRLGPDMVIVDISLKGRDGIGLVRDIHKYYKQMPMLVLSMHDEARFAERSLLAGAKGYIMKRETSGSIVEAIRCVLSGRIYLSEKIKEEILGRFVGGSHTYDESPVDRLTDRELEVFRLLGQGLSTNDVARQLNLSAKTVGTYRERIKQKLNLRNASELIRQAMLWVENERIEAAPSASLPMGL